MVRNLVIVFIVCFISNQTFAQKCDLPWFAYYPFDTIGCQKSSGSINQFKATTFVDTIHLRAQQNISIEDYRMEFGADTSLYSDGLKSIDTIPSSGFSFYSPHIGLGVKFNKGKYLKHLNFSEDTCKIWEVDFDDNGTLVRLFDCDYSKSDHCYSRYYDEGKLYIETIYIPTQFYKGTVNKNLPGYQQRRLNWLKEVFYKDDGTVDYERIYKDDGTSEYKFYNK